MAISPSRTTDRLVRDPGLLRHGLVAWLLIGTLYGIAAFVGGLNGFGAVVAPWVPIPADRYYLWMGPLTPLIYLLYFVLLAGLLQLFGAFCSRPGRYEECFAVAALTFVLPVFVTMWLFEAPVLMFFPQSRRWELGGLAYLPEWVDTARQIAGVLWIIATAAIAMSRVHHTSRSRAATMTVPAAFLAFAVMLTYLR